MAQQTVEEQRAKRAAYMRAYRAKNPDAVRRIDRQKYLRSRERDIDAHREAKKLAARRYREKKRPVMTPEDRAKLNEANRRRNRAYRERYKDDQGYKARRRKNRNDAVRKNPEKYKEYVRKFQATEHGKAVLLANSKVRHHRKRAAKAAAGDGVLTGRQWREILVRHGRCHYCQEPFTEDRRPTMDHKTPFSRGGLHTAENVVPACLSCNCQKKDRTADEFLAVLAGER